jgi:hypothetical protein
VPASTAPMNTANAMRVITALHRYSCGIDINTKTFPSMKQIQSRESRTTSSRHNLVEKMRLPVPMRTAQNWLASPNTAPAVIEATSIIQINYKHIHL